MQSQIVKNESLESPKPNDPSALFSYQLVALSTINVTKITRFQMRISRSMVCMMLMLLWIFISFTSGKLYIPRSRSPIFSAYMGMLCYIVFIIRVNALNEIVKCRMLSICWWSAISNNQSWSMVCSTVYAQHDICCYCPFYVERIRYISEKIQLF